ncbi:MAG: VanW family protein [Lapillicoccus sp.]
MTKWRPGVAGWVGLALLALAVAYVLLAVVVGRQVPTTASVSGVAIGGLTRDAALARLAAELGPRGSAPVTVAVGATGRSFTLDPGAGGLALDLPATLDGVTGFTLDPATLWRHVTGSVERPVVTRVDREALTRLLTERAAAAAVAPVDGTVTFAGGSAGSTPAADGTSLPVEPLVDRVAAAYPMTTTVTAEVVTTPPAVTQARVDAALAAFARPATSAPVTLDAGGRTAALTPAQLSPALSMRPGADGALTPVVDRALLATAVTEALTPVLAAPQDARIVIENDAPRIVPSVDGVSADAAGAVDVVTAALTAPERTARLATTVSAPSLTTAAAQALGVTEVVASFDSRFPDNPSRTANLVTASAAIDGTLLKPGETFSLNDTLGERTEEKGYREGYVIESGRLVKGTGGGVSQVSTVVYNLAWFAAADLVEHTPHSFYISRYPEGREATVYWPTIDNRFRNASPHGMLLQMWVADDQVHGRVWSTKVYDVEATKGARSNVRSGTSLSDNSTACVPQPEMTPGFDVTVTRTIRQNGAVVRSEDYPTSYQPEDRVVCTNPNHQS